MRHPARREPTEAASSPSMPVALRQNMATRSKVHGPSQKKRLFSRRSRFFCASDGSFGNLARRDTAFRFRPPAGTALPPIDSRSNGKRHGNESCRSAPWQPGSPTPIDRVGRGGAVSWIVRRARAVAAATAPRGHFALSAPFDQLQARSTSPATTSRSSSSSSSSCEIHSSRWGWRVRGRPTCRR